MEVQRKGWRRKEARIRIEMHNFFVCDLFSSISSNKEPFLYSQHTWHTPLPVSGRSLLTKDGIWHVIVSSTHGSTIVPVSLWPSAHRPRGSLPGVSTLPSESRLRWQFWTPMFICPAPYDCLFPTPSAEFLGLSPCTKNWQMHNIKAVFRNLCTQLSPVSLDCLLFLLFSARTLVCYSDCVIISGS